jgi:DNA modification methylase
MIQTLVLTPANIRNNYLRVRQFNGLIPQNGKDVGPEIVLELDGVGPVRTTVDQKKGIISERQAIKEFFHKHHLNSGDEIGIRLIDKSTYEIIPNIGQRVTIKPQIPEVRELSSIKNLTNSKRSRSFLSIGFTRTCGCAMNHLNCLSAKDWLKSQLGVWQFNYEGRDIRDKTIHPATFPISLARRVIELFTHKGELILDPFVGSGTTLIASQDTGRNAVGFDLNRKYTKLSEMRLSENAKLLTDTKQIAVCDDAREIPNYMRPETVSLLFTSPPYANLLNRPRKNKSRRNRNNGQLGKIEQYSQDPHDLGTMPLDEYTTKMGDIFEGLLKVLRPKAHCVINVPDMWWENKRITIHVSLIEELRRRGYELRNIIIWDRTNIVNKIGIFGWPSNYITMGVTFEYLLDFWRPPA